MRLFGKLALAFGLVALTAAPALAQGRGGFMGGGAMLLTNKSVQTELKATEDQTSKLTTLAEEIRGKQREAFQGLQDLSDDERRTKMQEIQKTIQADIDKGLGDILKADQIKRFHQIQLQQAGATGLLQARVDEALKLTDEQKGKIRDINQETMTQMQGLREEFQNDREGAMKKVAEIRKSANEKALAVLTDSQKTTYKGLVGSPFEIKIEPRPNN